MLHDPSFWFAVAFVLFCVLIGRKVWAMMAQGLDERGAQVKQALDDAENTRQDAEKGLGAAKRRRAEAETMAAQILEHAQFEAERLKSENSREIEKIMGMSDKIVEERIKNAELQAVKDIRDHAVDLGMQAAELLLKKQVSEDVNDKLIEAAISELEKEKKLA